MAKHGKRTTAARAALADKRNVSIEEAVALVKSNAKAKFDETIDVALNLGVDPRHADQMVRGVVSLPNGTGKTMRVAVFARGAKAEEATAAGADIVGAEDLMETIQGGKIEFDRCIATPDMMPIVGRLGKVLGPRNLMPNPKVGTVTMDVKEAVEAAKGGQVQFKAEKAGEEDTLTAEWQSQRGEHQVTDVQYERGNLSFKRKSKFQDREFESTFKGTIDRETDMLSGVISMSEMGEIQAEGKRIGGPLIGDWNLESTSERGTRNQRLRVNPDMSGLYGALPIKKVNFEKGRVDFLLVLQFGDQSFEMTFAGKLEDAKLTGELTSSRGSQKVKGSKIVRTFRRRSSQ